MARQITLTLDGATSSFDFKKVDRNKLYGRRIRMLLDGDGEPCTRASLTADGSTLLRVGMTAQGYFDDEGTWIPNADLVGLDGDGQPLEPVPSTLGVPQKLAKVHASEMLDMRLQTVYALSAADLDAGLEDALEAGDIFRFQFNYRPDFRPEAGFLVANEHGVFALVGTMTEPPWLELDQPVLLDEDVSDDDSDDLDFDFF